MDVREMAKSWTRREGMTSSRSRYRWVVATRCGHADWRIDGQPESRVPRYRQSWRQSPCASLIVSGHMSGGRLPLVPIEREQVQSAIHRKHPAGRVQRVVVLELYFTTTD